MSNALIAVIEDDDATRTMLEDVLEMEGYRTVVQGHSQPARSTIRTHLPDAIILDIWLEDMHAGQRLLCDLERDPLTRHIPVIVCSAHTRYLDAYQDDLVEHGRCIVRKPFAIADLLNAVARATKKRDTTSAD